MAKSKSLNYKTANKYLLNAISKSPDAKKLKVFKDKFALYKDRMEKNAESYFKNKSYADNFKYTIDTIEKRIKAHLEKGVYDQKVLQKQLNNLVTNSRHYQEQVRRNDKIVQDIILEDDGVMFEYIITHPIKTEHSEECAADLANSPFTKEQAIEVMNRKPNHVHCTCHVRPLPKVKQKRLLQSDNF